MGPLLFFRQLGEGSQRLNAHIHAITKLIEGHAYNLVRIY